MRVKKLAAKTLAANLRVIAKAENIYQDVRVDEVGLVWLRKPKQMLFFVDPWMDHQWTFRLPGGQNSEERFACQGGAIRAGLLALATQEEAIQ